MIRRINNSPSLARQRLLEVLLLASLGMFASCPTAFAQTFRSIDYAGEELFQRFCAACHGPAGHGDGPVASTLNVMVPDLTRLSERRDNRFPVAEIREMIDGRSVVIAHGTRTMPVWGYEFWIEEGGDINAEADARQIIQRLVDYLQSIQIREPGPGEPR